MPALSESLSLGAYASAVEAAREELIAARIVGRIWKNDHTVWKPDPAEIANRLGWLTVAQRVREEARWLRGFAADAAAEGITDALLLGMGGSSLAPDVFRRVFGPDHSGMNLHVLDSTDPAAVAATFDALDPAHTLAVVATKSGNTVETLSFFKTFYNRAIEALGAEAAGAHFAAITDAGSNLDRLAKRLGFREIFRNDPTIGGRYSALSYFGMLPAALLGMDVEGLLGRALEMAEACQPEDNPAARLGVTMGVLAGMGRDKLTFILSPAIAPYADWVEQLIAESTGKEGKGILPVVGEPVGTPGDYGADRLFAYLRMAGDATHDAAVDALAAAGQPVVRYELRDRLDIGAQMFLWEFATAVAGHALGINPFNQPNVESAKVRAREMVAAYQKEGALPAVEPALSAGGIDVIGDVDASTPAEALRTFVAQGGPGAYVSLQAYLQPTPATTEQLRALQAALRDHTKLATTLGYGPRFLHSTGQLHKGDGGKGLFVQITADGGPELPIPDQPGSDASSITFGVLKAAQALGDRQALLDAGRRVIRFHLTGDVASGLEMLIDAVG